MNSHPSSAVIMAGGQSERMKRSGIPLPKPLVTVAAVPLLERNVQQLVKHGFKRIFISIAAAATELRSYIKQRLQPMGQVLGIELFVVEEDMPLGNIGAVQLLPEMDEPVLFVYADNLTALNLRELVDFHEQHQATLTLAAHLEPFRMPYGELELAGDGISITNYREKPVQNVLISSAIGVIAPVATATVGQGTALGISDLCQLLIDDGKRVLSFSHIADWIDVNDRVAVRRAESLVMANPSVFNSWFPENISYDEYLVIADSDSVTSDGPIHYWYQVDADRPVAEYVAEGQLSPLMVFDDIYLADQKLVRCHVFQGRPKRREVCDAALAEELLPRVKASLSMHSPLDYPSDLESV